MLHRSNTWALVLAGGEGSRLQGLTRTAQGQVVPKQFCSLQGGPSLLQEALQRAIAIAPMQRVCTVVAAQHRQWWTRMVEQLPEKNVIVQPHARGTAHGILYPLLQIAARDPNAVVVLLPADHYLRDEDTMAESLCQATSLAAVNRQSIYLLGAEPEEPDTELGYIVPARRSRAEPARVLRFVEKPTSSRAQALLYQGALWNVFIVAASVRALLGLFGGSFAATIMAMRELKGAAFDEMYQQLRHIDFSRDVLQGNEAMLQVLPVPPCGWNDLGTPQRIALTLRNVMDCRLAQARLPELGGYLNLAEQYARQQRSSAAIPAAAPTDLHD